MGMGKQGVGKVELDLGRYELRRSGRRIKLAKKTMELLILLAARREQMVSREEIIQKLWRSDLFIDSEKNVNNIVRKVRTALGDSADKPRFLETVVGKGYRFVGPLRVIDATHPRPQTRREFPRVDSRNDSLTDRSSIAILPLQLLGRSSDDQGLCLGFADALVSRVGNLPDVDVLPTSAVLNLPLDSPASEIASHLGVRFVVHGAIQMSKGEWRLSLEMVDTYVQRTCFTRKCDLDTNRLPVLEGEVAKRIAAVLN